MGDKTTNTAGSVTTLRGILTDDVIEALSRTNRWGGFTNRPYSVLEHTVIGTAVMQREPEYSLYEQRRFMLHDVHEVFFMGDLPSPKISEYCNPKYYQDVREFDRMLLAAAGITKAAHLSCPPADIMDQLMRHAENNVVTSRDFGYPVTVGCVKTSAAIRYLRTGEYRGDLAIPAFHYHMNRLWPEWVL